MGTHVRLRKERLVQTRATNMRVATKPRQRETPIHGTSGITHAVAEMLVNIQVSGLPLCVNYFACICSQPPLLNFLTYCSTNYQPRQLLLALQGLVVMESMHALLWMILPLQLERNLAKTLTHVTRIPQTSEMQAAMDFTDAIRAQQSLDGTVVMENCLAKTILAVSLSIAQVHIHKI